MKSNYIILKTELGSPLRLQGDTIFVNIKHRFTEIDTTTPDMWAAIHKGDFNDLVYLFKKITDGMNFIDKDLQYWSDRFKTLKIIHKKGDD